MLLVGVLAIPKDQKKKIALSSQGMAVCKIPNKKAGIKIIKYSWTMFSLNRPLDSLIIKINLFVKYSVGKKLFNFDHFVINY